MHSINFFAQNEVKTQNDFLRVYNLEGKKISKGFVVMVNDSVIELKNSNKNKINIKNIGFIKTKRSAGNNVLIGALSGTTVGAVAGASSANPNDWVFSYSPAEGALAGGVLGAIGGGVVGSLTALSKKVETIIINGDKEKWLSVKMMFNKWKLIIT